MTELGPRKMKTPTDFFACPIWRYDEDDDVYYPVLEEKEIPEFEHDLRIRAVFTTPSGQKLDGYVVGISRVFSMGLFGREQVFNVNKNLKQLSEENMRALMADRPELGLKAVSDIFPLKYVTQIQRPGYRDFSGVFDLYG
jgi:hypothetical protein